MAGNGRDQYSHRGFAPQAGDPGEMTSSGYPRRSGYVDNVNDGGYQYGSAAPRPGVERNTSFLDHPRGSGGPQYVQNVHSGGYWRGDAAPQAGGQQDIRSLDQQSHRGVPRQFESQGQMGHLGHPRGSFVPQYVSDQGYPPQGALPQVGSYGNMPSFEHSRRTAAPQQGNDDSAFRQRSTAQLLAQFGKWQEFQKTQEDERAIILRNLIDHSRELGRRGIVSEELSRMIDILARDYQRLDHNLSRVTAEGFRDSGLRAAYPPNGGSNHGTAMNVVASNANRPAPAAVGNVGNAGGTRVPLLTECCGKFIPIPANPVARKPRENHQDRSRYQLKCIICGEAFRDHRALFTHFPGCVQQRGNVNGRRWFDHASVKEDKIPESLIRK